MTGSEELLKSNPGFIWASLIIFAFVLTFVLALIRGLSSRGLHHMGTPSDWRFAWGILAALFLGLFAWALHPLIPPRGWRWVMARDLAYHVGPCFGLLVMIVAALIKLPFSSEGRKRLHRVPGLANWKMAIAGAILAGFVSWSSWIAWNDILDLVSGPTETSDRVIRLSRGYRSLEGEIVFEHAGKLDIPHGLWAAIDRGEAYRIAFAPHRRLLVSCKKS